MNITVCDLLQNDPRRGWRPAVGVARRGHTSGGRSGSGVTYCACQGGLPSVQTRTEIGKLVRPKPDTSSGLGRRVVPIQVLPALSRHRCLLPADPHEEAHTGLCSTEGSLFHVASKGPQGTARGGVPLPSAPIRGPSLGLPDLCAAGCCLWPPLFFPSQPVSGQLQPQGCWHGALALPSRDFPRDPPPAGCTLPLTAPWKCGGQGSPPGRGASAFRCPPGWTRSLGCSGLCPRTRRPESRCSQPLRWLHTVPASCLSCRGRTHVSPRTRTHTHAHAPGTCEVCKGAERSSCCVHAHHCLRRLGPHREADYYLPGDRTYFSSNK